jgi:hypothetical protein
LFISNLLCPRPQQTRSNCISARAYLKSKSQPDVSIVHTKEQEDSSPFGFAMEADWGADYTYSRLSGLNVCTHPIEHAGLGSEAGLQRSAHWQKVWLNTNNYMYISKNLQIKAVCISSMQRLETQPPFRKKNIQRILLLQLASQHQD